MYKIYLYDVTEDYQDVVDAKDNIELLGQLDITQLMSARVCVSVSASDHFSLSTITLLCQLSDLFQINNR